MAPYSYGAHPVPHREYIRRGDQTATTRWRCQQRWRGQHSGLGNYPNPFNPETWIPYHLAHAADVALTLYNTKGAVVRRLELGHQPAGFYTARAQATYWDDRNESGELVASGVYFYQLRAGNYSALRRMVILK